MQNMKKYAFARHKTIDSAVVEQDKRPFADRSNGLVAVPQAGRIVGW